ncbi:acyl-CoA dehydrogenase family protein [Pseudomonas sp. CCC3.1]|uniref:acyl-CoA dehydrogenase family protein n=1 Tax=Pseudomonas sp. CCC3.1 TaxID=3048607 RepID=UPI002AC9C531|nr:acyl-CoA dehydrogenase family protein [Pseudomonas sp. CCC3.1]MEB0205958.1 acyl-CoA dehydrogenase family protein [Pseudomonas sp. CCC3.1]WPX38359.1 acyl-CoA dehydrogenase family protein [Pseudomonas sp. CCC3.1]
MPQLIMDDADGVLEMLRDSVAAFAQGRPGPQSLRQLRSSQADLDREQWQEMVEAGWIGLMLPETLGGAGLGIREQVVISFALGRALIPSPMATASVLSSALLAAVPESAEQRRLASGLIQGEAIVAVAVSEPGLTVRLLEGAIVLDGRCEFVDAAASATDLLVLARYGEEDMLVSVPSAAEGLEHHERPAVDGSRIASLQFSSCLVKTERVLARGALNTQIETAINLARTALAAELCGLASQAFNLTRTYTCDRVQFGKPIAGFQVIQHRLVDLWAEAEFACSAVVNAVERIEQGSAREARLAIYAAKARAADAATLIGRQAIHLFGAMGFTDECDIGLYLKRAINLGATLGQAESLRIQFIREERAA